MSITVGHLFADARAHEIHDVGPKAMPSSTSLVSVPAAPMFGEVLAQTNAPKTPTHHAQQTWLPTPTVSLSSPSTTIDDAVSLPPDEPLAEIASAEDEPITDLPMLRLDDVDLAPPAASWEMLSVAGIAQAPPSAAPSTSRPLIATSAPRPGIDIEALVPTPAALSMSSLMSVAATDPPEHAPHAAVGDEAAPSSVRVAPAASLEPPVPRASIAPPLSLEVAATSTHALPKPVNTAPASSSPQPRSARTSTTPMSAELPARSAPRVTTEVVTSTEVSERHARATAVTTSWPLEESRSASLHGSAVAPSQDNPSTLTTAALTTMAQRPLSAMGAPHMPPPVMLAREAHRIEQTETEQTQQTEQAAQATATTTFHVEHGVDSAPQTSPMPPLAPQHVPTIERLSPTPRSRITSSTLATSSPPKAPATEAAASSQVRSVDRPTADMPVSKRRAERAEPERSTQSTASLPVLTSTAVPTPTLIPTPTPTATPTPTPTPVVVAPARQTATASPSVSTSQRAPGAVSSMETRTAAVAAGSAALLAALQQEASAPASYVSSSLPQALPSPLPPRTTPAPQGMTLPDSTPSWMAVAVPTPRSSMSAPATAAHEEITAPVRRARGRSNDLEDGADRVERVENAERNDLAATTRLDPISAVVVEQAPPSTAPHTTATSSAKHEAVLERVQELLNDPASNVYFDGRHAVLNVDGLTVRLSTDSSGQTQVSMHTTDPTRAEQLVSTSSELARGLQQQGLQLATMNVQTSPPAPASPPLPTPSSSQTFSGGQQHQQAQQQDQRQPSREEPAAAARPGPARTPAPPSRGIRA